MGYTSVSRPTPHALFATSYALSRASIFPREAQKDSPPVAVLSDSILSAIVVVKRYVIQGDLGMRFGLCCGLFIVGFGSKLLAVGLAFDDDLM
jgi:hypothetical protein